MNYIYNLIAFSQGHIDAWQTYQDTEQSYQRMSEAEKKEFADTYDRHKLHTAMSAGKAYRGSFLDRDALIKLIESQNDHYGICEGYYNYLLIEKHVEGMIDGLEWGEEDTEIWYKAEYEDEKFRYVRIEKPSVFIGTVSFT